MLTWDSLAQKIATSSSVLKFVAAIFLWIIVIVGLLLFFRVGDEDTGKNDMDVTPKQSEGKDVNEEEQNTNSNDEVPDKTLIRKQAVPNYMKKIDSGDFDIEQGRIKFDFTAEGPSTDENILILSNFNEADVANLFYVGQSGPAVNVDFFTKGGGVSHVDLNVNLDQNYSGKNYSMEILWDFTQKPNKVKLFLDGRLQKDMEISTVSEPTDGKFYIGNVRNLIIE